MSVICYKCSKPLGLNAFDKISYSETCEHCDADVRACKNCKHYDTNAYNGCKENQAERVVDKERRTYCDYFSFVGGKPSAAPSKSEVFSKMDELFKK